MVKLFISFAATLRQLRGGQVTVEDMEQGIFCFGNTRAEVFEPWACEHNELALSFRDDGALGERLHRQLLWALVAAEQDRRVAWRDPDSGRGHEVLDWLLQSKGIGTIFRNPAGDPIAAHSTFFAYPDVERMVKEAKLPLSVVI